MVLLERRTISFEGETMATKTIEFDGKVSELIEALEKLEDEGKGQYWVEAGPYMVGGKDDDHSYSQDITVDDENERIFLEF